MGLSAEIDRRVRHGSEKSPTLCRHGTAPPSSVTAERGIHRSDVSAWYATALSVIEERRALAWRFGDAEARSSVNLAHRP
jgi:hypothetical protein